MRRTIEQVFIDGRMVAARTTRVLITTRKRGRVYVLPIYTSWLVAAIAALADLWGHYGHEVTRIHMVNSAALTFTVVFLVIDHLVDP